MGQQLFANNISTTLNGAITSVALSLIVNNATGFPAASSTTGAYFYATLADVTNDTWEVVKVTNVAGTTFTVVRGQDNTTALAWSSGSIFEMRPCAQGLRDLLTASGTSSGGRFKNLQVIYGQSTGVVTVTADECTVSDLVGNETRLTGISVTASLANTGVIGGTDGCTLTAGNFYTVFVAYNPTTGVINALISSEPTSNVTAIEGPASPISGFSQHACASINKIKSASSPWCWLPGVQNGMEFTPTVGSYLTGLPVFVANATIGTWSTNATVAQSVRGNGALIPYHAATVTITMPGYNANGSCLSISPNNNYGAPASTTNPPPFWFYQGADQYWVWMGSYKFNLESNSLYVAAAGTYVSFVSGWMLNL
jgi:hypothetical protein